MQHSSEHRAFREPDSAPPGATKVDPAPRLLRHDGPLFVMRLPRWQRWCIFSAGTAIALSGIVWLALQLSGATEDPLSEWRSMQSLIATAHGLVSLFGIALIGSLIPVHVRLGWRFRKHVGSGLPLLVALLVLVLTGAALYYVASEDIRAGVSWAHEIAGVLCLGLFALHRW